MARSRDRSGENASPTRIELLPDSDGRVEDWGVRQVSSGWEADLDAAILVDRMTRAWLAHTRAALMSGQRPDGKGPQKPLGSRALADPDRTSSHRGYNSGELADGLRRTAITSDGPNASSRCLPPANRNVYVAQERARGVALITGDGAAGEAAAAAAREVVGEMLEGRAEVDRGERKAGAQ